MPNLYFGSFVNKNSFIHRLDARIKIFYIVILSTLLFSVRKLSDVLVFSFLILSLIFFAKIERSYIIKNVKKFFYIFLFIFSMYILFSNDKITEGMVVLWRFLMLILISLVLNYTTSISGLTLAIEKLSGPLKIFGIKPRNIALMISVAVRFIPLILLRLERSREAMLARLADFKKLKNLKILVISLLENMFISASNLSDAMSARLYNENASSTKIMRFARVDYISILALFLFALWFLMI